MSWLLDVIGDDRTVRELARYFAEGPAGDTFTGRAFESIGQGGDRAGVQDSITAEDLVAVEMLSVRVPAEASIALLRGTLGDDIRADLRLIPTDVEAGTPEGRRWLLQDPSASQVWSLLRDSMASGG